MKRFTKIMAVFAALVLALAFVGCKNDTSDSTSKSDGSPAVVAEYEWIYESYAITATFFDDGTFSVVDESEEEVAAGTYDGDPSKDGKIKLTFTKFVGDDSVPLNTEAEYEIENGKVTINDQEYTRK